MEIKIWPNIFIIYNNVITVVPKFNGMGKKFLSLIGIGIHKNLLEQ